MFRARRSAGSLSLGLLAVCVAVTATAQVVAQPGRTPQDPRSNQGTTPFDPEDARWAEGRLVQEVLVARPIDLQDEVRRALTTKAGQEFSLRTFRKDLERLADIYQWTVGSAELRRNADDSVSIRLVIDSPVSFDRLVLRGVNRIGDVDDDELRAVIGVSKDQRVSTDLVPFFQGAIEQYLRRKGYRYVEVVETRDVNESELILTIDAGPQVRVERVDFTGNYSFPFEDPSGVELNVAEGSRLQSRGPSWRLGSGKPFSNELLDEDLDRLRSYYRRRGFLDAEVFFGGVQELNPAGDQVALKILVDEGRRYRISKIEVNIVTPEDAPDPLYSPSELREELEVEVGSAYDEDALKADVQKLQRFYAERGHIVEGVFGGGVAETFRARSNPLRVDPENAIVEIEYEIIEGTPKTLREFKIAGNTFTKDETLRRFIQATPGERIDAYELERVPQRLQRGGLINARQQERPRLTLRSDPDDPRVVDATLNYVEQGIANLNFGAALNSANGLQGRVNLTKPNFDAGEVPEGWNPFGWFDQIRKRQAFHGGGQFLSASAVPGTQISLFSVAWNDPDAFGRYFDPIGLRLSGFRSFRLLDSFNFDALGARVSLTKRFEEEDSILDVGFSLRQETIEIRDLDGNAPLNIVLDEGTSEIRAVGLSLDYEATDNYIDPTTGFRSSVDVQLAGGLFGADEDFYKLQLAHTQFLTVNERADGLRDIIRVRAGFDYGRAFGRSNDLFIAERYYLGGLNNLRGFQARFAGPQQFGNPTGGSVRTRLSADYSFVLSSERREGELRATDLLRGIVFVDSGTLGLGLDDLGPVRVSTGMAVQFRIPALGPFTVGVGYPVFEQLTDQRQLIFFTTNIFF